MIDAKGGMIAIEAEGLSETRREELLGSDFSDRDEPSITLPETSRTT